MEASADSTNLQALGQKLKSLQQQLSDAERRRAAGELVQQSELDALHAEVKDVMGQLQGAMAARGKTLEKPPASSPTALSDNQSTQPVAGSLAPIQFSLGAAKSAGLQPFRSTPQPVPPGTDFLNFTAPAQMEFAAPAEAPLQNLLAMPSAPQPIQPEAPRQRGSLLASRAAAAQQIQVPLAGVTPEVQPTLPQPNEYQGTFSSSSSSSRSNGLKRPGEDAVSQTPPLKRVMHIEEAAAAEILDLHPAHEMHEKRTAASQEANAMATLMGVHPDAFKTADSMDPQTVRVHTQIMMQFLMSIHAAQMKEVDDRDPLTNIGPSESMKVKCTMDELLSQKTAVKMAFDAARGAAAQQEAYIGELYKYDTEKNYGFIRCEETRKIYERDIFLQRQHFVGIEVGDTVFFQCITGERGHPQAKNVRKLKELTRQNQLLQKMQAGYLDEQKQEHGCPDAYGEEMHGFFKSWKDTWGFIVSPENFQGELFAHRANFIGSIGAPKDLTGWSVKFRFGTINGKRVATTMELGQPAASGPQLMVTPSTMPLMAPTPAVRTTGIGMQQWV